jgi:hypothetical protein
MFGHLVLFKAVFVCLACIWKYYYTIQLCNYNVRTTVCLLLFADFENKSVSLPSVNHISDVIAMGICTLALYSEVFFLQIENSKLTRKMQKINSLTPQFSVRHLKKCLKKKILIFHIQEKKN